MRITHCLVLFLLTQGLVKMHSYRVEAIADSNFDFGEEEEDYKHRIEEMYQEKYKEDWLNIASKWLEDTDGKFIDSLPDIQTMIINIQKQYNLVHFNIRLIIIIHLYYQNHIYTI